MSQFNIISNININSELNKSKQEDTKANFDGNKLSKKGGPKIILESRSKVIYADQEKLEEKRRRRREKEQVKEKEIPIDKEGYLYKLRNNREGEIE